MGSQKFRTLVGAILLQTKFSISGWLEGLGYASKCSLIDNLCIAESSLILIGGSWLLLAPVDNVSIPRSQDIHNKAWDQTSVEEDVGRLETRITT